MFGSIAGRTGLIVPAALIAAYILVPIGSHRELGPNDPIAADGSMQAGRNATIYDTMPEFTAVHRSDSDDPRDYLPLMKADHPVIAADRALFKGLLLRPLDASLCKARNHRMLLLAVRVYYDERGREKKTYGLHGPRATAAVQNVWSTPADIEIDDYVRHAVQYGLLHKSELRPNLNAEFAKTVADVQELGTGCTAADR